ncbi:HlyD family type I secretion periplasmic adaptor subunit [Mesorhizobium sp. L-2-11]|uniref:HlyD family type I secretion periplasmic adaptor subunit n=1 Tax=Mesorhizobium sp. L-2-11 TaxID=2744521 RepID=UPI0019268F34|nr:HlyD family type I secretion periplasmic adaptor subunit [Mesorhizobium sp. L-2-11]
MLGFSAICLFFGGFGAWAALAPLSSAASAPGQVRALAYRKTIQHLEGGIIRELLVGEGDIVEQGQVMVRLEDVQARSSSELIERQYWALQAQEARLLAEREGAAQVVYPINLAARRSEAQIRAMLDGQDRIFEGRKASLANQVGIMEQRAAQLESQIDAHRAQLLASDDQIRLLEEEVATVRDLTERGYEKRPRLMGLERELAQLKGDRGEQLGMIARAKQQILESHLQIADLRNAQSKEIEAELREVQTRMNELEDRLSAASDVQNRTEILAPHAGRVVQLRHVTTGGVIRPGDAILDLVPTSEEFVVEARISPLDIDSVRSGLDAEVRLLGLNQRSLPILLGKVASVSADVLTDQRSGERYYLAEISFPEEQLHRMSGINLYPGMPTDVLVVTGQSTLMGYFLEPVRDSFRKAFREH